MKCPIAAPFLAAVLLIPGFATTGNSQGSKNAQEDQGKRDKIKKILKSRIGEIVTESGYPTEKSIDKIFNVMDFQRACQAYLWGIPAVGLAEWKNAHFNIFKARNGQLLTFTTYEEKLGILTANYTTPYIITIVDLKESGPFVLELPEGAMAGMVMDYWQRVICDLSLLGPDKGKGGKYLFLPPGHKKINPEGYFVFQSPTRHIFGGVRLLDADREKAIKTLVPKMRTYPYADRDNPPKEQARPAGKHKWSQAPRRGLAYWKRLAEVINEEEVADRDRFILAQLRFLGIEKGKPFKPNAQQVKILKEAAFAGELMAKANTYERRFEPAFWPNTQWKHAINVAIDQRKPNYDQLDERAAWFYEAVTVSKGMLTNKVGFGQRYIASYRDKDGKFLTGENSYRLHVPPNPPAERFWSVTVYSEDTRCFIVNSKKAPDLSSRQEALVKNEDGSVDLYFGPTAPKGKESNWIQTNPGEGWFVYFRFYSPTEAFFDRSWGLPDFEKVK